MMREMTGPVVRCANSKCGKEMVVVSDNSILIIRNLHSTRYACSPECKKAYEDSGEADLDRYEDSLNVFSD